MPGLSADVRKPSCPVNFFGARLFSATAKYRYWPALITTIDAGLFLLFTACFAVRNAMSLALATLFVSAVRESLIQVVYTIGRHSDQKSRHSLVSPTSGLGEFSAFRDSLNPSARATQ